MPKVKEDPNYLQKNKIEIVKKNDSVPVLRQVPGPDNPLGKVKFLFPNSYEIFFHDTPAKELFEKNKRAYSHGCIRLENAKQLVSYLLRNDQPWTSEKIDKAMNSGKEQFVNLKKSVPVVITYYTAWVDENGQLNFRDDVYKHDVETSQRLFTTTSLSQPMQQDSIRKDSGKRNI
jgi:L,D-transpeptidase YcbB